MSDPGAGTPPPPSWGQGPGTVPPPGAPPQPGPVAPQTGSGPSGPRAGFWRRFGAALLDGIMLGILLAILIAAVGTGAGYGLYFLAWLAYTTYFEGSPSGQTIGKRALGIRVIDFGTGGPIGYTRAFIRWLGKIVSSLPLDLGYLWMLWDKEKQTWHDKFANSVVVPTDAYPVTNWPG